MIQHFVRARDAFRHRKLSGHRRATKHKAEPTAYRAQGLGEETSGTVDTKCSILGGHTCEGIPRR